MCAARSPSTTYRSGVPSALKGIFGPVTETPVTYVNAPLLARERGCEVRLVTNALAEDFRNVTTQGTLADGRVVSVAGTLTGPKMVQKVIGVNGFDLEIPISQHMAFYTYKDRPGVIGALGKASWATPRSTSPACRCRARRDRGRVDRRQRHPAGDHRGHRKGNRGADRARRRPRRLTRRPLGAELFDVTRERTLGGRSAGHVILFLGFRPAGSAGRMPP